MNVSSIRARIELAMLILEIIRYIAGRKQGTGRKQGK